MGGDGTSQDRNGRAAGSPRTVTVALAGNPNAGKTTLFNNLTGAHQHVANYPGVTVEKKEGWIRREGRELHVVDLPGTYSLTAYTLEERLARSFIIDERPDVVVDVVDASNLERNLYLATQLMELGVPLVLALNMSDQAKAQGYLIDTALLAQLLGVRIVPTVGHRNRGTTELYEAMIEAADGGEAPKPVHYGREIERELSDIVPRVESEPALTERYHARWVAVKLLEGDEEVTREVTRRAADAAGLLAAVSEAARRIERDFGDTPEAIIADRRYGFISGACLEAVRQTAESRHTTSDRIDSVVTHGTLGILIFLGLMYLVFRLTFWAGAPLMSLVEMGVNGIGRLVGSLWPAGSESVLRSLVVDGIISGVGKVLVFLPNILLLFLAISILEDSGYMARAAFILDRFMHKIGLHGKSFIPMLIGFGCTVPAILATRTLDTRRDRMTTMLVLPLVSCSARLPIYMLFIPAFFPEAMQTPILWSFYVLGIVLAVAGARLLRSTVFRGEMTPFVMELPPYRMPTLKGTLIHMWGRGWHFIRKAGTIILGISIVMWALMSYPKPPEADLQGLTPPEVVEAELSYSVAGRAGRGLHAVMRHAGFDRKASTALIGAFAAKEMFVSQMGIMHSLGDPSGEDMDSLRAVLKREYTPLEAVCIMLFCLVSAPCMATIAVTWRESGSWGWAAAQLVGLTLLAYVLSLAVFQAGTLLHLGT